MYCKNCGNDIGNNRFCASCGFDSMADTNVRTGVKDPGQAYGIAALVCGIASIVLTGELFICLLGIASGIVALVMSGKYRENGNGSYATHAKAGRICAIIGVSLNGSVFVFLLFGVIIGFSFLGSMMHALL